MNNFEELGTTVAADGNTLPSGGSVLIALSAAVLLASLLMALSASLVRLASSPFALDAITPLAFGGVSLGLAAGAFVAVLSHFSFGMRARLIPVLLTGGALMSLAVIFLGWSDQSFVVPGLLVQSAIGGFAILATLLAAMRRGASRLAGSLVMQLGIAGALVATVVGWLAQDATSIVIAALTASAVAALVAALATMSVRPQPALSEG